jgi:hypothetical protein
MHEKANGKTDGAHLNWVLITLERCEQVFSALEPATDNLASAD